MEMADLRHLPESPGVSVLPDSSIIAKLAAPGGKAFPWQ
jgi:hypothetical protein